MVAVGGCARLVYLGSRSQMLAIPSVAARHTNLAHDCTSLLSSAWKEGCCPSCSLIQRRVREKKFVATWLMKLVLAINDFSFSICRACGLVSSLRYMCCASIRQVVLPTKISARHKASCSNTCSTCYDSTALDQVQHLLP